MRIRTNVRTTKRHAETVTRDKFINRKVATTIDFRIATANYLCYYLKIKNSDYGPNEFTFIFTLSQRIQDTISCIQILS